MSAVHSLFLLDDKSGTAISNFLNVIDFDGLKTGVPRLQKSIHLTFRLYHIREILEMMLQYLAEWFGLKCRLQKLSLGTL